MRWIMHQVHVYAHEKILESSRALISDFHHRQIHLTYPFLFFWWHTLSFPHIHIRHFNIWMPYMNDTNTIIIICNSHPLWSTVATKSYWWKTSRSSLLSCFCFRRSLIRDFFVIFIQRFMRPAHGLSLSPPIAVSVHISKWLGIYCFRSSPPPPPVKAFSRVSFFYPLTECPEFFCSFQTVWSNAILILCRPRHNVSKGFAILFCCTCLVWFSYTVPFVSVIAQYVDILFFLFLLSASRLDGFFFGFARRKIHLRLWPPIS